MLLAMVWLPIAMMAGSSNLFNSEQNPKAKAEKAVTQSQYFGEAQKQVLSGDVKLKADTWAKSSVKQLRKVKGVKAVTSAADLKGEYVMTYNTLSSTKCVDGGRSMTVEPVEGTTDSIAFKGFWEAKAVVKAKYDATTRTITIPNQVIGTDATLGQYDLAVIQKDGKPDRTSQIVGSVDENGVISIDSWWGVFVMSGTYANQYIGAYYNTEFIHPNAHMSYKVWNSSSQKFQTGTYGVYVEQPATNVVTVKNFANYGLTVTIELNRDETATIATQIARKDLTNGDWQTVSTTYKDDYSGLTAYNAVITCNKATDRRTISWGNWTLLCSKYYLGAMTEGKIETDFDLAYPTLSVTEFEGEGTEAKPYLIKSLDDLILLSDKVNGDTEYIYGTNAKYTRPFLGKYFRMENDIDMSGYRFQPIGADWNHQFAGTFDGKNHTITGLTVNTGASGYAGLFGKCDTVSIIKNIKFEKPVIETANYYAGVVAAWTLGTIANCSVNNAVVSNMGQTGAAGIAAIADKVLNCSVTNSNITGAYGYAAGVAGQVNTLIRNSYATNVSIKAGGVSATYPSGGVVGSLYKGSAESCYFSGVVDGRYQNDLSIGGIAGVCYQGSIERCFSTGTLYGYYTAPAVGGIVGNLYGSVVNCYSTCNVSSPASRYTGGITGYIRSWKDNAGNAFESTVKNCYTAAFIDAEDYQYDPTTERRETIGKVMDGANPTLENIYYDRQMTDYKSTAYGAYTSELTSAAGVKGFDAKDWVFTEGVYPRLKSLSENAAAKFSVGTISMFESCSLGKLTRDASVNTIGSDVKVGYIVDGQYASEGRNSKIEGNTLKLKESFGTDTICFIGTGIGVRTFAIKISPIPYDGAGTEENPYLLKTKEDLIILSNVTTTLGQLFPDTYFKFTNDIDLEKDPKFLGICSNSATTSANDQFAGHIDGAGFTLHNMYIANCVEWKVKPEDAKNGLGEITTGGCQSYKGFIGRLGPSGSLKNLTTAADCDMTEVWASSAPLVAYNYGVVENCKNYADIKGYSCWIGGIVGQNTHGARIRNCYNAGRVTTGYMNAGGIAGANYGLIENCENAGDVEAKVISTFISGSKAEKLRSVGGIVGATTGGRIVNCVNSGTITGYGRVGGLSGTLAESLSTTYEFTNDVLNSVNYGTVLSVDKIEVGAVGGQTGTKGEIKNVYYDGQITVLKANGNAELEGATAVETSALTSGKALDNLSADIWSFEAGKYPVLKQFADEALVKKTRSIIMNIAAGESASDLKTSATLSSADDCTWALKNGSEFKIEGGKLLAPADVKALIVDTIVATAGNVVKPIVVMARPSVPVSGAGTAADPYLIKDAKDWNNFAEYMALCSETMFDKYVKLDGNISFADVAIKPFSYDGVTIFDGNFDGAGYTVDGISYTSASEESGAAFKSIGENAYVHDLTVGGAIKSSYAKTGGIFGSVSGKVENVTSKVNVTVTASKSNTAGFAGAANSGAELINCVNEGNVTSAGTNTAGFVGYSYAGVKYTNCGNKGNVTYTGASTTCYLAGFIAYCNTDTIIGCYNTGKVEVSQPTKASTVSGFIGMANAASGSDPYYIKDCYNTANITSLANNAGLIVAVNASGNAKLNMDGCYNTGDITTTATVVKGSTYTAGLVAVYPAGSTFRNCWNSGTITSVKPVYAGGLFGYYKGTFNEDSRVKIVNCYNAGDIVASGNQGGGIIAYSTNYVTVDSCYNVANVEGGFGLGGIAGCFTGNNSKMLNCWNSGDITTSTNRAGGLIGYNGSTAAEITNCYNLGDISSTGIEAKDCYGVGGIAGYGSGHYTNVYSTGDVSGVARVGGLIGYPSKATVANGVASGTSIENGYFAGTVTAPADSCGMIIGVNMIANGKVWNENNVVKNVYYLKDAEVAHMDTIQGAVSVAELTKVNLGNAWVNNDYCFPVLKDISNTDEAKLASIAIVLAEGDKDVVTANFYMGCPEGVTLTSNNSAAVIEGNLVRFTAPFTGDLVITATAGNASVEYEIPCAVKTVGVDGITDGGKVVVKEVFYNAAGVEVAKPEAGSDKAVYVVVKTYDDGTTAVVKEVR